MTIRLVDVKTAEEILQLRDNEGLSFTEIGRRKGISQNRVREIYSHVHRTLRYGKTVDGGDPYCELRRFFSEGSLEIVVNGAAYTALVWAGVKSMSQLLSVVKSGQLLSVKGIGKQQAAWITQRLWDKGCIVIKDADEETTA